MKLLTIVALLAAGALAVPAPNSCPSSPGGHGGDHSPSPYPTPTNNGGGNYPLPSSGPPPHHGGGGSGGSGGGGGDGGDGGDNGDNGSDNDNGGGDSGYRVCTGLYSTLQCCATDVLGVADLNCRVPDKQPNSGKDFQGICAEIGEQAKCCVLPILGQALLCVNAVGSN